MVYFQKNWLLYLRYFLARSLWALTTFLEVSKCIFDFGKKKNSLTAKLEMRAISPKERMSVHFFAVVKVTKDNRSLDIVRFYLNYL